MRMYVATLAALAFFLCGERSRYVGPNVLGPFRIDRDTTLQSLFSHIGDPTTQNSNHYCYRSSDSKRFLWIDRMAHVPKQAGDILLSDFSNCMDQIPQVASEDLSFWKTDKGVGLGSTESNVLHAYGSPSRRDKIDASGYRWVIRGDHSRQAGSPERGDRVLVYQGAHDDLRTAQFGIRDGRVAWIFLSHNE